MSSDERLVTLENARWLATLLSPSNDPERQAEARRWADEWFAGLAEAPTPAGEADARIAKLQATLEAECAKHDEQLAALTEAARDVVAYGNQPGWDDDEWEKAMALLESALPLDEP